jgi:hypothetical protein
MRLIAVDRMFTRVSLSFTRKTFSGQSAHCDDGSKNR